MLRRSQTSQHRRDEGSMMLALVVTFMVVALVGMLLVTIYTGQRGSRHDARFTTSVQGGDAGIQQAYLQINQLPLGTTTPLSGSGEIDGVVYEWKAEYDDALAGWRVTSTGTANTGEADPETSRTVEAVVRQGSPFDIAVFGDELVEFHGSSDSKPSPGQGFVGTNGVTQIKPKHPGIDGYVFYDSDTKGVDGRCSGGPVTNCEPHMVKGEYKNLKSAVEPDGFIYDTIAACKAEAPLQGFEGYSIEARDEPYCFSYFLARAGKDGPFEVTGPRDKAARIFVDGGYVTLGTGTGKGAGHAMVNMAAYDNGLPLPRRLQIFSNGPTVAPTNHGDVAAVIYAPNATCFGEPGDSQSSLFGSVICGKVDYQNPTRFTYDTRLAVIGDGRWTVSEYNEP